MSENVGNEASYDKSFAPIAGSEAFCSGLMYSRLQGKLQSLGALGLQSSLFHKRLTDGQSLSLISQFYSSPAWYGQRITVFNKEWRTTRLEEYFVDFVDERLGYCKTTFDTNNPDQSPIRLKHLAGGLIDFETAQDYEDVLFPTNGTGLVFAPGLTLISKATSAVAMLEGGDKLSSWTRMVVAE